MIRLHPRVRTNTAVRKELQESNLGSRADESDSDRAPESWMAHTLSKRYERGCTADYGAVIAWQTAITDLAECQTPGAATVDDEFQGSGGEPGQKRSNGAGDIHKITLSSAKGPRYTYRSTAAQSERVANRRGGRRWGIRRRPALRSRTSSGIARTARGVW